MCRVNGQFRLPEVFFGDRLTTELALPGFDLTRLGFHGLHLSGQLAFTNINRPILAEQLFNTYSNDVFITKPKCSCSIYFQYKSHIQ